MKTIVLAASLAVACAGCDQVKNLHGAGPHSAAAAHAEPSGSAAIDLQGGRMDCTNSMVQGFYALSREAFAGGPDRIDLEAYKQKTFAFMREDVLKAGGTEKDAEGWIAHVEDIPRQMIGIVKNDPKVLDTCEAFSIALSGPP